MKKIFDCKFLLAIVIFVVFFCTANNINAQTLNASAIAYRTGTTVVEASGNGAPPSSCTGFRRYTQLDGNPPTEWYCVNGTMVQETNISIGQNGKLLVYFSPTQIGPYTLQPSDIPLLSYVPIANSGLTPGLCGSTVTICQFTTNSNGLIVSQTSIAPDISTIFNNALITNPNLTIHVTNLVTSTLTTSSTLAFHTDCSAVNNGAFSLNLISNGTFSGPQIATTTVAGICPSPSDYTLGNWAAEVIAIENGGSLLFSNCGLTATCPNTSPNLSQSIAMFPTFPSGACPNAAPPGPNNQAAWGFGAVGSDGHPHIYTCSNTASSVWTLFI